MGRIAAKGLVTVIACVALVAAWQSSSGDSAVVVFFGRPTDLWIYATNNWVSLSMSALRCLFTALLSLTLAALTAITLLTAGLMAKGWATPIERLAASSQAVPFLVVVTVALLFESALFDFLALAPPAWVYSVGPVTIALLFPPLVNGADAVRHIPIQIKGLVRLWNSPTWWRIERIYLPRILPAVFTGIRASATWAVGATLIAEGLLNGVNGDSDSLGHYLLRPFSSGAPGRTPVVIILSVALGFGVYYLFVVLQARFERRLLGPPVGVEHTYPV